MATFSFTTSADQDATLAAQCAQTNATIPRGDPPYTPERLVDESIGVIIASFAVSMGAQKAESVADAYAKADPATRAAVDAALAAAVVGGDAK